MVKNIKLNIVSDVVCPWCVIGYKRMQKAIAELGIHDKVELEWHPFELNLGIPRRVKICLVTCPGNTG